MYSTVKETALRWGISDRRVRALCAAGKVPGAYQVGRGWNIPDELSKPFDGRYKNEDALADSVFEKRKIMDSLRPLTRSERKRIDEEFSIDFIYNSNAISGSSLTLRETDLVMRGISIDDKPRSDCLDVSCHKKAWDYICDAARSNREMTVDFIKQVHYILAEESSEDRGEYRSIAVRLPGSQTHAVQPWMIESELERLLYEHSRSKENLCASLARFHIAFQNIQPFIYGSEKIGRLILNYELLKAGYPPIIISFTDRKRYFDSFESYRSTGSIEEMESLILSSLNSSLDERINILRSKPQRSGSLPRHIEHVVSHFEFIGYPISCEAFGNGHINNSYYITTDRGNKYVLQRISSVAFHDVPGLMNNALAVSRHIASKGGRSLEYIITQSGKYWYSDEKGDYWRAYKHIPGLCLQTPEIPEDFYESAIAFGSFQNMLDDFPAETLSVTIPDFHNTPDRYLNLHKAVDSDSYRRAAQIENELDFAFQRENESAALMSMLTAGELPLRVTHNDTKLSNVLLHSETRKAVCVIDLDTVMPGLSAFDFGDAIRSGVSSAREDEKNLDAVKVNLYLFRLFTRGFLKACPKLTEKEKSVLPLGAKIITLECGVRFITDYLEGDRYFGVTYPEQNLDRARTQFKLVKDIEKHWSELNTIIREESDRFT